jgi:capping protein alpha
VLINNDAKLQSGIKQSVRDYNLAQFTVAKLGESNAIVSKWNELSAAENLFYEPKTKKILKFDHIRLVASEFGGNADGKEEGAASVTVPTFSAEDEKFREELDAAVSQYVANHYPLGVSLTVYVPSASEYVVLIVDNKYNPVNFWNGRWRSEWHVKPSDGSINGVLRTTVHYYEDGNVQLNSDRDVSFSDCKTASDIVKKIKETEHEYQQALNESYVQLGDSTFKGLRRALPVTRNKLDWNKVNCSCENGLILSRFSTIRLVHS